MVITSTIGNRVAVMSGTWVQIPPSPPNKKTSHLRGFLFCENGRMKPRAAPARGAQIASGNCPALTEAIAETVRDRVRWTKQGALRSGRNTVNTSNLFAMDELMFQQAPKGKSHRLRQKKALLAKCFFQ